MELGLVLQLHLPNLGSHPITSHVWHRLYPICPWDGLAVLETTWQSSPHLVPVGRLRRFNQPYLCHLQPRRRLKTTHHAGHGPICGADFCCFREGLLLEHDLAFWLVNLEGGKQQDGYRAISPNSSSQYLKRSIPTCANGFSCCVRFPSQVARLSQSISCEYPPLNLHAACSQRIG